MFKWHPGLTLESLEKQAILQAISYYKGNKTMTAQSLGMSIRTLDAKLEKYGEREVDEAERKRRETFERDNQLRRARGLKPIAEMPEETDEEKEQRIQFEEKEKRDEFNIRQKGGRPIDPNSLEAEKRRNDEIARLHGRRDAELAPEREARKLARDAARKENEEVSEAYWAQSKTGTDVQSDSGSPAEHEMPVPFRKEVQGVLPKSNAGTGSRKGR